LNPFNAGAISPVSAITETLFSLPPLPKLTTIFKGRRQYSVAVSINFGAINVTNVRNNSNLFYGENVRIGVDNMGKVLAPGGEISGSGNLIPGQINVVNDQDFIDSIMNDRGAKGTAAPSILKFI
jgi:hypothetical protein